MRKFLALGALLILLALMFWSSVRLQEAFFGTADFLGAYVQTNEMMAYLIFIGLSALSAMLAPLSSIPLIPFAVLYWGVGLTQALLLAGWLIGGVATYFIGAFLGTSIVKHLVDIEKVRKYRNRFSKRSEFALILLFRLAMPAEIPGYLLGIIRYPFWLYMAATFIAELPIAAISVYLGESLVEKQVLLFFNLTLTLFLLFGLSFYFFMKKKGTMEQNR